MNITLGELAEELGARLEGDPDIVINGVADIASSRQGHITFAESNRYFSMLKNCKASAVILPEDAPSCEKATLRVKKPRIAFVKLLQRCHPPAEQKPGIHKSSIISESASISEKATIGPLVTIDDGATVEDFAVISAGSYIGRDAKIGANTFIHPNVSVLNSVNIGKRCIIHANSVLGSDGYGFVTADGIHHKIPQVGIVEVGDDVEIGSCVTVDRATFGITRLGNGTKIDNLVHIAHNVVIGEHCLIVAQVGISGSVHIGDRVTLAGQVGVVGHLTIGSGSIIAARAVVTGDLPENSYVSGFPAKPHKEEIKIKAAMRKLPKLLKMIQQNKCADAGVKSVLDGSNDNGDEE